MKESKEIIQSGGSVLVLNAEITQSYARYIAPLVQSIILRIQEEITRPQDSHPKKNLQEILDTLFQVQDGNISMYFVLSFMREILRDVLRSQDPNEIIQTLIHYDYPEIVFYLEGLTEAREGDPLSSYNQDLMGAGVSMEDRARSLEYAINTLIASLKKS